MSLLLLKLDLDKNIHIGGFTIDQSKDDQSSLLMKISWKKLNLKKKGLENNIDRFFIEDLDKLIIFVKTVDNKYFKRKFDGIQIWEPITEDKFTNEQYKSNFFDDSIVIKWPTNNPVSILKTPPSKWVDTKITSCNFFENYPEFKGYIGPGGPLKNDCIFGEKNGKGFKNKWYLLDLLASDCRSTGEYKSSRCIEWYQPCQWPYFKRVWPGYSRNWNDAREKACLAGVELYNKMKPGVIKQFSKINNFYLGVDRHNNFYSSRDGKNWTIVNNIKASNIYISNISTLVKTTIGYDLNINKNHYKFLKQNWSELYGKVPTLPSETQSYSKSSWKTSVNDNLGKKISSDFCKWLSDNNYLSEYSNMCGLSNDERVNARKKYKSISVIDGNNINSKSLVAVNDQNYKEIRDEKFKQYKEEAEIFRSNFEKSENNKLKKDIYNADLYGYSLEEYLQEKK